MTADSWADTYYLPETTDWLNMRQAITTAVAEEREKLENRMKDAIKEITAGMALTKSPEWDKGDNWNNASLKAIGIIEDNLKGEGLFQGLAAAIRKGVKA